MQPFRLVTQDDHGVEEECVIGGRPATVLGVGHDVTGLPEPTVVQDVEAVLQPHQLDRLGHVDNQADVGLVLKK